MSSNFVFALAQPKRPFLIEHQKRLSVDSSLKHLGKVSEERDSTDRKFKMATIEILMNE